MTVEWADVFGAVSSKAKAEMGLAIVTTQPAAVVCKKCLRFIGELLWSEL